MPPSKIHQLLHGYSKGHTLLSGSFDLPPDVQRQILVLSDLSGATTAKDFESYLTAYPLPKVGYFAIARTWSAPEMRRPGCVWTHTLLFDSAGLSSIANFGQIESLFRRPEADDETKFDSYSKPIADLGNSRSAPYKPSNIVANRALRQTLSLLYEAPRRPVVIFSDASDTFESLITALWLQQWPELRGGFSFCTGAISPRQQNNAAFDLQVCPRITARSIRREAPNAVVVDPDSSAPETAEWIETLANDVGSNEMTPLRQFLWTTGKTCADRTMVVPLVDLYLSTRLNSPINERLPAIFLKPNRFSFLKFAIESADTLTRAWLQKDSISKVLETISRAQSIPADYGPNAGAEIAELLNARSPNNALLLAADLGSGNLNEFGQSLLATLIELAPTEKIVKFLSQRRELVYGLLHRRPSLAGLPEVWQLMASNQTDLADAIIRANPDQDTLQSAVRAALSTRSKKAIGKLASKWPEVVVTSLLGSLTSEQDITSWEASTLSIIGRYPEIAAGWLGRNVIPVDGVSNALALLDPLDPRLKSVDFSIWLKLSDLARNSIDNPHAASVQAFLTSVAFSSSNSERTEVLKQNFSGLHFSLEENRLDADAWEPLSRYLPELGWWQWDKCERLRRGVLKEIGEKQPDSLHEIFQEAPNEKTLSFLVESLLSLSNGRSLLKKLVAEGTFNQKSPQLRRSVENALR